MTRYLSDFECTVCHEHIIFDSDAQTLTCGCHRTRCTFVNLAEFHPIPCDRMQTVLTDLTDIEK